MDGDGPSQAQRQLSEDALHLRLYLARLLVERVACVLPLQRLHLDGLGIALAIDRQHVLADVLHTPDAPVVVLMIARRVVLDEHHLSALLQHQRLGRRVRIVGERAFHLGTEAVSLAWKLLQLRFVVGVCQVVVSGQAYGSVKLFAYRRGMLLVAVTRR